MRSKRSAHELRCFCSRHPLLAVYGLDEKGNRYVHVRIYKQNRIFGEVVATGGEVKLHCRECLRWHKVVIRTPTRLALSEDSAPVTIPDVP